MAFIKQKEWIDLKQRTHRPQAERPLLKIPKIQKDFINVTTAI
ncbi:MAG: hypothetical protein WAU28_02220 [Candidatus Moraniibacteriota bacterium]